MAHRTIAAVVLMLLTVSCGGGGGGGGGGGDAPPQGTVLAVDFQPEGARVEAGFVAVTPGDAYSSERGLGFTVAPRGATDGARHTFNLYGRTLSVDEVVPASVLSDATRDCVVAGAEWRFRADVEPGDYDVTLWFGDVTAPRHQVRAVVNGVVADVARMDINHLRGSFDQAIFGSAVPRTVRVAAPDGFIEVVAGSTPGGDRPVEWTFTIDEDPKDPRPREVTAVLVPAFTASALQALTLHPAADAPLVVERGELAVGAAPGDAGLEAAVDAFNRGDVAAARAGFEALAGDALRVAKAAGLFRVAGHPATLDDEPALLADAETLLVDALAADPRDHTASDLLLEVRRAADAERYRASYGYAASGASATENMGRSCSLVEGLPEDHPYFEKGRILWLRNRGGLDPRRVTVSWERAQWLARGLDPEWGAVNPYVHLYATDEWESDGTRWTTIDWSAHLGAGPDWARSLVANLNAWLDLFEWWAIHRQAPEGDIGGGWTDDVEIVPAFGLMAFVLEDASDISRHSVVRFADGLWDSDVMDRDRGYQKQYADVEHTAEPTGNILHLYPLVRFGDPEGFERLIRSAKTFDEFFLTGTAGHRHFKGNYLSSTQIAQNPNHRADIPLCGRVTAPFTFLVWYSGNPAAETALTDWVGAWVDDAARAEHGKPAGIFPQSVWTPTDEIGYPGKGDWWSKSNIYGLVGAYPGYQFYLYDQAAFLYLRTGEQRFRAPHDAAAEASLEWHAAGRRAPAASPPPGGESEWCGAKLGSQPQGAIANLARATGAADWDAYLDEFGGTWARFLRAPTDASPIEELEVTAEALLDRWPYRTTEGLMTDRILVPGWADVVSYYLGAEVFSVFFGMPVHAVTWRNTTRLFAAAVHGGTEKELDATVYLFSDTGREIGLRLWQLELGAEYELTAGPATGLGQPAASVTHHVRFRMEHLGDGISFDLPGRSVYAISVRQVSPPDPGGAAALADLGVAPRDVNIDAGRGEIRVTVHNIGAAKAAPTRVTVHEGPEAGGPEIGSAVLPALPAPVDLVPKALTVAIPYGGGAPPITVTVTVDPDDNVQEITEENNRVTATPGAGAPPPPMLFGLSPARVAPGGRVTITGKNLGAGLTLYSAEAQTGFFSIRTALEERLELFVATDAPPGTYLLSVRSSDGLGSNLLPLIVENP